MNRFTATVIAAVGMALPAFAAGLSLQWPLGRSAYQTNETFDLAVIRSAPEDLPKSDLVLTLTAADGTKNVFTFPVPAVAAVDGQAQSTEVFHINGRLLRPGKYNVAVSCNNMEMELAPGFELFSHLRMSSFVIGDWGSRVNNGTPFHKMGEESLGFNFIYGEFRKHNATLQAEGAIRGGMDYAQVCTQSGAHQMDLRMECDWSDPYVLGGGAARGVQQAYISRTHPNALAVHLYDEPGLTWEDSDGVVSPFTVSAQYRSYRSAFDYDPFPVKELKSGDENMFEQWAHFQRWHLSFMDAAWKDAQFAIAYAQPQFMTLTQSVYGYSAYADGYYFNVVRSLPLISGHGGYSDGYGGFMYPAVTMEYGRMREGDKPYWYLPSWYMMGSDQYRLEQYLCFQNGLQGQMKPPDYHIHTPNQCANAEGIVEANKLQLRLGTIFANLPAKRPAVAVLYSMSQNYHGAIADIQAGKFGDAAYLGGGHTRSASYMLYFATKLIQVPTWQVVEEDILDGTVAKNHTVLILAGVNYLEPNVLAAVEAFAASGGHVLVSDECKVKINGAKPVGAPLPMDYAAKAQGAWQATDGSYWSLMSFEGFGKALAPYCKSLSATLAKCGVKPAIETDRPTLSATVQGNGDIEYLFLVNATNDVENALAEVMKEPDEKKRYFFNVINSMKSLDATIALPDDGRPVYDAVHGGVFGGLTKGNGGMLTAKVRFGPGSMKVLARTARPIGGVQMLTPTQRADMTWTDDPIRVTIGAVLVDDKKDVLTAVVPMEIQLTDPMGVVRYSLLRASDAGVLKLTLPLAANDPAGAWKVTVRELLTGQAATKSFTYAPPAQCGAMVSATRRALYFGNDRENIFRFFRLNQQVTIVIGESEFNLAAAERIKKIVEPWGVTCTIVPAKDHAGPRNIPAAAHKTWVGLAAGRPDFGNPHVSQVGFAIDGPVILVGNPEDHPMIKFGLEQGFLAYKPEKDVLPGRGRGMIAWASSMVGYWNQESAMVIAYDAAGMAEAVGTMYEACAAIDPLTATILPKTASIQPVKALPATPKPFTVAWKAVLNDRVDGLKADGQTVTAFSHDGSEVTLAADGKITKTQVIGEAKAAEAVKALGGADLDAEAAKAFDLTNFHPKKLVKMGDVTVVGYWGGLCRAVHANGEVIAQTLLPNDITSMAVAGDKIIVGLADGAVMALTVK